MTDPAEHTSCNEAAREIVDAWNPPGFVTTREQKIKLRNQWVPVDPREWDSKFNMTVTVGLGTGSQEMVAKQAMGVDWMTLAEISESIPPAYAEHIGRAAIAHLTSRSEAAA